MIILSPSILGADFTKLGEQVAEVDKAGAQYIHLDVMDGAFVPSISFGMPVIKSLRPVTDRVFDVHMMVEEPGRYVEDIKKAVLFRKDDYFVFWIFGASGSLS